MMAIIGIIGESTNLISQTKSRQILCNDCQEILDQTSEEDDIISKDDQSTVYVELHSKAVLMLVQSSVWNNQFLSSFSRTVKKGRDRCIEVHNLKMYPIMV